MLPAECVPPLPQSPSLLLPPAPVLKQDNWPLLTVSKGFFETLAAKGAAAGAAGGAGAAGAAGAAAAAAVAAADLDENELEGAGWGDELDLGEGGQAGEEDAFGGEWLVTAVVANTALRLCIESYADACAAQLGGLCGLQ